MEDIQPTEATIDMNGNIVPFPRESELRERQQVSLGGGTGHEHKNKQKEVDKSNVFGGENIQKFNEAHECRYCYMVVCGKCRDEGEREKEMRREREEVERREREEVERREREEVERRERELVEREREEEDERRRVEAGQQEAGTGEQPDTAQAGEQRGMGDEGPPDEDMGCSLFD
jgi:trichohyalin